MFVKKWVTRREYKYKRFSLIKPLIPSIYDFTWCYLLLCKKNNCFSIFNIAIQIKIINLSHESINWWFFYQFLINQFVNYFINFNKVTNKLIKFNFIDELITNFYITKLHQYWYICSKHKPIPYQPFNFLCTKRSRKISC